VAAGEDGWRWWGRALKAVVAGVDFSYFFPPELGWTRFTCMVEVGGIGKADVQQLRRRWTAPWRIVTAEALGQGGGWLKRVGKGLEQC
jgi:hypothetical protein